MRSYAIGDIHGHIDLLRHAHDLIARDRAATDLQARDGLVGVVRGDRHGVLVDAGVGTASDAAIAMELGCDGVLMNTAIAGAKDPIRMARAMKLAIEAGREAFLAGRIPRRFAASPSSPMAGRVA